MDRYFYSIEIDDDNNQKVIHLSGNLELRDEPTDDGEEYSLTEWKWMYMSIDEAKRFFEDDDLYNGVLEEVRYIDDLYKEDAMDICENYFGSEGCEHLSFQDITEDTPCGNYWC